MSTFLESNNNTSITTTDLSLITPEFIQNKLLEKLPKILGTDSNEKAYKSIKSLWDFIYKKKKTTKSSNDENKDDQTWYNTANNYWDDAKNCPISDDGVLGGFGSLTPMDTQGSNAFLDHLQQKYPGFQLTHVADCGAGIGRVTKHLLLPRCQFITLIEQSQRLIQSAEKYLSPFEEDKARLTYVQCGLQDFQPSANSYDLIWIQWVIGHLHDHDFITFFQRCMAGLTPNGMVILKDNVITDPKLTFNLDLTDYSVCRNLQYFQLLFELANVEIIDYQIQSDFPEEIYPVYMFALRPKAK